MFVYSPRLIWMDLMDREWSGHYIFTKNVWWQNRKAKSAKSVDLMGAIHSTQLQSACAAILLRFKSNLLHALSKILSNHIFGNHTKTKICSSPHTESTDEVNKTTTTSRTLSALGGDDLQKSQMLGKDASQQQSHHTLNDYDPDNKSETETKSLSSVKSNGSNPEFRYSIVKPIFLI